MRVEPSQIVDIGINAARVAKPSFVALLAPVGGGRQMEVLAVQ